MRRVGRRDDKRPISDEERTILGFLLNLTFGAQLESFQGKQGLWPGSSFEPQQDVRANHERVMLDA